MESNLSPVEDFDQEVDATNHLRGKLSPSTSSSLRRQFLDTMSDDTGSTNHIEGRDDFDNEDDDDIDGGNYFDEIQDDFHMDQGNKERDHVHTISFGISKHEDDDDRIFDLSDEEDEEDEEEKENEGDEDDRQEAEADEAFIINDPKSPEPKPNNASYNVAVDQEVRDEAEPMFDSSALEEEIDDPSIASIPSSSVANNKELQDNMNAVEEMMNHLSPNSKKEELPLPTPPLSPSVRWDLDRQEVHGRDVDRGQEANSQEGDLKKTSRAVQDTEEDSNEDYDSFEDGLKEENSQSLQDSMATIRWSNLSSSTQKAKDRSPSRDSSLSLSPFSSLDDKISENEYFVENVGRGKELADDVEELNEEEVSPVDGDNSKAEETPTQDSNEDLLKEKAYNQHLSEVQKSIGYDSELNDTVEDEDKILEKPKKDEAISGGSSTSSKISAHNKDDNYHPSTESDDEKFQEEETVQDTDQDTDHVPSNDIPSENISSLVRQEEDSNNADKNETLSYEENEEDNMLHKDEDNSQDRQDHHNLQENIANDDEEATIQTKVKENIDNNRLGTEKLELKPEKSTNEEEIDEVEMDFTLNEISKMIEDADIDDIINESGSIDPLTLHNDSDVGKKGDLTNITKEIEDKEHDSSKSPKNDFTDPAISFDADEEIDISVTENINDENYDTQQYHEDLDNSRTFDSLEDLLNGNERKADLFASFNAQRAQSPHPILEANSSLSSSSSKFETNDVPVFSTHDDDEDIYGDYENNEIPSTIYSPSSSPPATEFSDYADNHYYDQVKRVEPKKFAGNRLYSQGIQRQRLQALSMKNHSHRKGNMLDLSTRAYNERSQFNQNRGPSVYNRLYSQPTESSRMYSENQAEPVESSRSNSVTRPRTKSVTRTSSTLRSHSVTRSSNEEVVNRLYNPRYRNQRKDEDSAAAVQSTTRRYPSSKARRKDNDGLTANERLYNLAKKKRVLEMERENRRNNVDEKRRSQSRIGSNTSTQKKGGNPDIFDRLYYLAKAKTDEKERNLLLDRDEKAKREREYEDATPKKTEKEANEGFYRLYSRSFHKQLEGKKRRETIERSNAPRPRTPSTKITVEEAIGIYNRGMLQKMSLEIKREEEGFDKNYVSPLLNPLVEETQRVPSPTEPTHNSPVNTPGPAHPRTSSRIRSRSRLRSMSTTGTRSQTPLSRSDPISHSRNQTPSRNNATPSRRTTTPLSSRRTTTPQRTYSPISRRSATPSRSSTSSSRSSRTYRQSSRVRTPNTRTRSPTPSRFRESTPMRRKKQDSTRQMLRKLESDMQTNNFRNMSDVVKKDTASTKSSGTKSTKATTSTTSDEKTLSPPSKNHQGFSMPYLTHAQSQDYVF